jgi:glycosyltransferase involved in cell wall biosynthesis
MPEDVTAIISCMTDGEKPFVRAALESVANQTMPCAIRLYVTDTNEWIDTVIEGLERIVVRRIPMMPVGATRNVGINEADSDFVAFLDGDDIWLPEKTERQAQALRQNAIHFAGADHILIDEAGKKFAFGMAHRFPMASSWFVRRDLMLEYPFDGSMSIGEDWDWWFRTAEVSQRIRITKFLLAYRVRSGSTSSAYGAKKRKELALHLSQTYGLRAATLAATYVLNRYLRKSFYLD